MQSGVVLSLNHDVTTSFHLHCTSIYLKSPPSPWVYWPKGAPICLFTLLHEMLPILRNNSIITDLTQSNHGIIVVTDVIVATWYVVIIVAQLKEDIQHHGP